MELYNTYTNTKWNETYQIGDQSGKEPFGAEQRQPTEQDNNFGSPIDRFGDENETK